MIINDDIKSSFEEFATILTYLLFCTEVERHPAAAIHNLMALDLLENNKIKLEELFGYLPMSVEKATSVTCKIQKELNKLVDIPYYYHCKNSEETETSIEETKNSIKGTEDPQFC